ncbi:sugar phosphate nucleotidyltransferase [Candidatus Nitrospira neomarina]|uniref:Sugar phosphate nucleotidyltransferase n=1 Tax=Candidatus Nitrospira neomarina TaxID=3020899 RepID=A0AA96GLD1_9BACT|nr:sugar phosphate nucleotidyltransferase [Candidatus Nitrospira neomarina]WNM62530.1 sugar phosphate nucleotidyltransferase [Candidatus Nitrospira neomarina]
MQKWIDTRGSSSRYSQGQATPLPPQGPVSLWSLVLAGGHGERLREYTEQRFGAYRPKQYCAFMGKRSMIQHTWRRAKALCLPHRVVTVMDQSHWGYVRTQLIQESLGRVVWQPDNRGTGPGVFLPLSYIRAHDPHATVVLWPSDHFIFPVEPLIQVLRDAAALVQEHPHRMVLLTVPPQSREQDYGWVIPGHCLPNSGVSRVREVRRFVEKPQGAQLEDIALSGGQWNTLVLIANIQTLWEAGRQCIPEVVIPFEEHAGGIGTSSEHQQLLHLYRTMPTRNFSSDLLSLIPQQLHMMDLTGVYWSDWGRPERIEETIACMRRRELCGVDSESVDQAWMTSRQKETVQEEFTGVMG